MPTINDDQNDLIKNAKSVLNSNPITKKRKSINEQHDSVIGIIKGLAEDNGKALIIGGVVLALGFLAHDYFSNK